MGLRKIRWCLRKEEEYRGMGLVPGTSHFNSSSLGHSLRRAALRAASSAAVVPKAQTANLAARFVATRNPAQVAAVTVGRFFNTSAIRFNDEPQKPEAEQAEAQVVNAAVDAAEEGDPITAGEPQSWEAPEPGSQELDLNLKAEPNGVYGIFVWNVPYRSTEREMFDTFSRFGKVHSLNIGRDARGLSRGFAFVYYQSIDDAKSAITQADGAFWQGRRIGAKPKNPSDPSTRTPPTTASRARSNPTSSLYIGNIPYEATDSELNNLFSGLDNILDVRVAIDKATGWPRGFAHADFADVDSATKALEKLSAVSIQGRLLRLDYSETTSKRTNTFVGTNDGPGPNDKVL
ncbi:hypothetical protein MKZ38_007962 [Zalerion maritima]|uniref:RRM domain-containing protein n=1 Tax=Zalerion maritima TaxID=339359 RepID=A0AAD5RHM4_9PEZI|nr:hypothetical protein MKZ38_007962 [Zalerion maritima]